MDTPHVILLSLAFRDHTASFAAHVTSLFQRIGREFFTLDSKEISTLAALISGILTENIHRLGPYRHPTPTPANTRSVPRSGNEEGYWDRREKQDFQLA